MTRSPRLLFTLSFWAALGTFGLSGAQLFAKELPNYDALDKESKHAAFAPRASEQALIKAGTRVQSDDRLGVPTFVWAAAGSRAGGMSLAKGIPREEQVARRHLGDYASLYRLGPDDVQSAVASSIHNTGNGAVIVAFQQRAGGIEVFRDEIRIVMDQDLDLVAISGYIPGMANAGAATGPQAFALDAGEAIAAALKDYLGAGGQFVAATDLVRAGSRRGGYDYFDLSPAARSQVAVRLSEPARIKQVLFHLPDTLEPAYYVELNPAAPGSVESDYYSYVISAVDGRVLFRNNLTVSDSFTYRVWADSAAPFLPFHGPQGNAGTPHPTGVPDATQPPFIAPSLVTLQNGPISTNDPWLAPGATQTTGNNVEAYADLASPDGFSAGDLRASTTTANTFDRTYDTTMSPAVNQTQQMAAITQLFFLNNFFHDWYYDSGFNEISRNAQTNNFGRGGLQADSIRAEAQDFSGTDNANMSTPADGGRPRMQMYVFTGIGHRALTVNTPAGIAGDYAVGTAAFGPATFSTTGNVVLVDDGAAPGSDACTTPFANAGALSGKIALIDRGTCSFVIKVKNAQVNGAVGVVIANNTAGTLTMGGTDATIVIPSLLVSQSDGDAIRAQLGGGVNLRLARDPAINRDGTIDNQIVAHEWGHYISNRLIGNAAGLSNNQGRGMGEGWGDFHAMLMTVRTEDSLVAANANWNGVYALASYVTGGGSNGPLPNTGYYFGIRRYPYSTDLTKDPLTLKHIANGVPLPVGPPLSFGADGLSNSEVHNTGEVWTSMLWECYAGLLRDTLGGSPRLSFDQARDRMRSYLVAAYKATPNAPTIVEARDAVLAAAAAADPNDYVIFWKAFAKRGAGFGAVAPNRNSSGNVDLTESYQPGVDLALTGATLSDDLTYCDNDGVLDNTETGRLIMTLQNAGSGSYSATTATITSTNPNVSFPGGNTVGFPGVGPSGTTSAFVTVALNGVSSVQQLDFSISFDDPAFIVPGPRTVSFSARGNLDDAAGQTAMDDVESSAPRWTISGNGSLSGLGPWRRQTISSNDHLWHGPDPTAASDQYLISPLLHVSPTGSFSFSFRHRYYFEFTSGPPIVNFDGGVIEISTNGGSSWTDIGASAAPGYVGVLGTGGGNPLGGRNAYTQISPGYPAFITTSVSLGTAYQSQNVMIRFRIGTDTSGDDPGWDIDDVAFANITSLPFNALLPDRAICVDSDGDTFIDRNDCAPFNAAVWAVPTEALNLDLDDTGGLSWSAPTLPGATAIAYDLLRSDVGSTFTSASCLESDDADLVAIDPSAPAAIYYYLVRSQNGCGGNLGTDSAGTPRTGASCP